MSHIHTNKKESTVLNQILEIFFTIDKKIMDLHSCSSDDFLAMNKALKENHQKARYITENASLVFDKIGDEGNLQKILLLKDNFEFLQKEFFTFENQINNTLSTLERIQSNFSLMFVPINNFRQNLASLKLLLSNIKLNNTFFDYGLRSFTDQDATKFEGVINKVKDYCPVFEENIYNIQNHIKTVYADLSNLKDTIFNGLLNKLEVLKKDLDAIESHHKETMKSKNRIEDISQSCNQNVGRIITNLQYHDIIRQKMNHIQQTHKLIIKGLNENDSGIETSDLNKNPFFIQIPQITEIQVAQLLHTNKEYQDAIEQISNKMIEIGQDMTSIARIAGALNVFENNGSHLTLGKISDAFKDLIEGNKKCLKNFKNHTDEVSLVYKIVNELFDKFKELEAIENSIEQSIIDKISFGNFLISEEKETATKAQQIIKLYADNHFEKNKIRSLFENTRSQLKDFFQECSYYIYEVKGIEKISDILESTATNFAIVKDNLHFVEKAQQEILNKSEEIHESGKQVVNEVKYYDFFEKTIDDLIIKFDMINELIKIRRPLGKEEKAEGLRQIEDYYTMKSERIVHNQAIFNKNTNGSEDLSELFNVEEEVENNNKDDGNDVEFF